jgi:hypothetical protein
MAGGKPRPAPGRVWLTELNLRFEKETAIEALLSRKSKPVCDTPCRFGIARSAATRSPGSTLSKQPRGPTKPSAAWTDFLPEPGGAKERTVMATQEEIFLLRAQEARREAEAATLDNVRQRCLRSEAAWLDMAHRAARTDQMRAKSEAEKARAALAQVAD